MGRSCNTGVLVFKDDLLETLFKQNPIKHIWPKHLARDVTSRSTKSYSEHRFRIVDSASEPSHVCIICIMIVSQD